MIGTAWPRTAVARWAGGLYLAYVLANVLASRLGHIGLSDADTLRATITGDEVWFRLGLVAAISSALLFVLTAWALYVLLRPVNEQLALLLLILNAIGVAVQCASYLPLFAVLAQSDSVGLTVPQLDGLAMLSVTTHQTGFIIAQVFFSAWLFPLGWLVLRSGFLPGSSVGSSSWTASRSSSGSCRHSSHPDTPRSATPPGRSASSPRSASRYGSSSKAYPQRNPRTDQSSPVAAQG